MHHAISNTVFSAIGASVIASIEDAHDSHAVYVAWERKQDEGRSSFGTHVFVGGLRGISPAIFHGHYGIATRSEAVQDMMKRAAVAFPACPPTSLELLEGLELAIESIDENSTDYAEIRGLIDRTRARVTA